MIANFKTFSDALARNSDKVDSVVAGLERMTGGAAASGKLPIYTLNSRARLPARSADLNAARSRFPSPPRSCRSVSDKILIDRDGSVGASIENAQWSDNLPVLFQAKVIESFENSGYFQAVGRPIDGFEADDQVLTTCARSASSQRPQPAAVVAFSAKILSGGRMAQRACSRRRVPIAATDGAAATAGLNQAFDKTVKELVAWAAENIGVAGATGGEATERRPRRPTQRRRTAP